MIYQNSYKFLYNKVFIEVWYQILSVGNSLHLSHLNIYKLKAYSRKLGQHSNIGKKIHFFKKRGTKNFTTPIQSLF